MTKALKADCRCADCGEPMRAGNPFRWHSGRRLGRDVFRPAHPWECGLAKAYRGALTNVDREEAVVLERVDGLPFEPAMADRARDVVRQGYEEKRVDVRSRLASLALPEGA